MLLAGSLRTNFIYLPLRAEVYRRLQSAGAHLWGDCVLLYLHFPFVRSELSHVSNCWIFHPQPEVLLLQS